MNAHRSFKILDRNLIIYKITKLYTLNIAVIVIS